MIDLVFFPYD